MPLPVRPAPLKFVSRAVMVPEEPFEFPITDPPRILVVEDDKSLANLLHALLSSNWFDCTVRGNGSEAVQCFLDEPADLIITDLKMSYGDGVSLIQAIRAFSNVPIIIITGYAADYMRDVRACRNVAVMPKPFDASALVSLVDLALDTNNRGSNAGWNAAYQVPNIP